MKHNITAMKIMESVTKKPPKKPLQSLLLSYSLALISSLFSEDGEPLTADLF